ncbi:hypothetical protein [Selenomonas sp. CM52]|uniref:hypothetical protein n=1 Tax=Selenomonas sp. CM52 TaxID=936381 RepID=UPI001E5A434E|nr:hypothetical protein [Selenomonas sp. CM52]
MEIIFDASIGGRTPSALSFRRLGKRCDTTPRAGAAIPIIYTLIISFSKYTIKHMQKAQHQDALRFLVFGQICSFLKNSTIHTSKESFALIYAAAVPRHAPKIFSSKNSFP